MKTGRDSRPDLIARMLSMRPASAPANEQAAKITAAWKWDSGSTSVTAKWTRLKSSQKKMMNEVVAAVFELKKKKKKMGTLPGGQVSSCKEGYQGLISGFK